jgi:hypothetical protein
MTVWSILVLCLLAVRLAAAENRSWTAAAIDAQDARPNPEIKLTWPIPNPTRPVVEKCGKNVMDAISFSLESTAADLGPALSGLLSPIAGLLLANIDRKLIDITHGCADFGLPGEAPDPMCPNQLVSSSLIVDTAGKSPHLASKDGLGKKRLLNSSDRQRMLSRAATVRTSDSSGRNDSALRLVRLFGNVSMDVETSLERLTRNVPLARIMSGAERNLVDVGRQLFRLIGNSTLVDIGRNSTVSNDVTVGAELGGISDRITGNLPNQKYSPLYPENYEPSLVSSIPTLPTLYLTSKTLALWLKELLGDVHFETMALDTRSMILDRVSQYSGLDAMVYYALMGLIRNVIGYHISSIEVPGNSISLVEAACRAVQYAEDWDIQKERRICTTMNLIQSGKYLTGDRARK